MTRSVDTCQETLQCPFVSTNGADAIHLGRVHGNGI